MRALPLLGLAVVAAAGGYYLYSKKKGSPPAQGGAKPIGTTASTDGNLQVPVASNGARALTPDQKSLVDTMLGDYILGAPPAPVPGCASAAMFIGRKPQEGESVDGSLRMTSQASSGVQAGGEVYLDPSTVGAALVGTTPPAEITMLVVDPKACKAVADNAKATGWFLYASPLTAVA